MIILRIAHISFNGPKDNQIFPIRVQEGREQRGSAPLLKDEVHETFEAPSESFETQESVAAFPLHLEIMEAPKPVRGHVTGPL